MDPYALPGIQFLQAWADGTLPNPSMTDTVPMRAIEVSLGYTKLHVMANDRHLNLLGGVHGGFAATVLDSVSGCAIHTMLEAGVGYGTVDLSVKMFRPIPVNIELIAEGRIIHMSKSIGASEGTIKNAEGKLYAHATCTCAILRRPIINTTL